MASELTKKYVNKVIELLSVILQTNKINDLSPENLKRIIYNSNILDTKLKITNKKRISGWHAYVSKHRKNLSMVDMAEKWKNTTQEERKYYNQIAFNMRESNKEISNKEISNKEIYNKEISNKEISNKEISNKEISNKEVSNKEISNKEISNKEISNKEISNKEISNKEIYNKEIYNKAISNKEIYNKEIYNKINKNIRIQQNGTNIYSINSTKWNIFKKNEIKLGNTNLNIIKNKFSTLTQEEIDKL